MEKYLTKIPQLAFSTNKDSAFVIDVDTTSSLFSIVTKRAFEEKENPKLFGVFMVSNEEKEINEMIVSWYFNEYVFDYEIISGNCMEKDAEIIQNQLIRFLYTSSIENTVYHFNSDRGIETDNISKFMLEAKNESGIIEMIIGNGDKERTYKVGYMFHKNNIESSMPKIEEIISETNIKIMPNFHAISQDKKILH